MNPETESFYHGVSKCKETINNIVRKTYIQLNQFYTCVTVTTLSITIMNLKVKL